MDKFLRILMILYLFALPSLNAANQSFKKDSIKARDLYYSAIDLARKNLYRNAIDSFKFSLQIRKKIYGEKNYQVGMVQNALGINYKNIGQLDKALDYFLQAEQCYLVDSSTTNESLARLYNNVGNVYKSKLNYITTIEYFEQALHILSKEKNYNGYLRTEIIYSLATSYFDIQDFTNVLSVIHSQKDKVNEYDKLFYLDLEASVYQTLELNEKADKAYNEAIAVAIKLDYPMEIAYEYLNYATFLGSIGETDKAFAILQKAYEIIVKTEKEEGINLAEYYFILGRLHTNKKVESNNFEAFKRQKTKNIEDAIRAYKKGLRALHFSFDIRSDSIPDISSSLSLIQSLDILKLIADSYVQIAMINEDRKKEKYIEPLKQSIDYYKVTSDIIQKARKEISSDESKIKLTELEQATFQKMIHASYKAYEITLDPEIVDFAFKSAERIKASSVFDRLSDELAKNNLIPDSLIELEKTINYSITQNTETLYYLQKENEPQTTKIEKVDSILFQLKKQRTELNQYLEKKYSSYYELKYSDQLLGIAPIQKKLKSNEVVIEYVFNENDSLPKLYTFFISSGEALFLQPEIDTTFVSSVEDAFYFMSNPKYMFTKKEDSKDFCTASYQLYQKLIQPFEKEIENKRILIVPDGKLNYLAFDALIDEMPDTTTMINFARLNYLVKKNSINYSYSANLRYKFTRPGKKSSNNILAFAPQYNRDTFLFNNQAMVLVPLPGVQKEVEMISNEIKTSVFKGEQASEYRFRQESKKYEILHLAMHAFIDDSNPAFSRLAFTQNEDLNAENNGWLNTADIYNLDLNAKLTVLSACNTGAGNLRKGEGVMSLARGFLYAGCPSIVMTLWEVDDKAGTQIMGSFYRNLKKGRATDEALRLAKLEYLENANPRTAHPHYWLGYVSIGDSSPLFRSYDFYFFGLLMIVLLGVTIDQIIRAAKARKNLTEQQ